MFKVLIADSDPEIRHIIADALKSVNCDLHYAENGGEALDVLRGNLIHLLLVDRELGGKDGLEILQELKKNRAQTPVVMLTDPEDDEEQILEAGAYATLAKPFNIEELRDIVVEIFKHIVEPAPPKLGPSPEELERIARAIRRKKNLSRSLIGLTISLCIGAAVWFFFLHDRPFPLRIFALPDANISGIAPGEQILWSCDWFNQSFYKHNRDAILSVAQMISKEDWHPAALTWDGKNLWSISAWEKRLARHKMDTALTNERVLVIPWQEPTGLFFDGEFFWTCDAREAKIIKFSAGTTKIEILESANAPGQRPVGIWKDKKFLWTADSRSGLIYKHLAEKNFKVIEVYSLPDEIQNQKISCFSSDGKSFWIATESSQKIYQIHPKTLKLIGKQD